MYFRHVNYTANTSSLVTFEYDLLPNEIHQQECVDGRPQSKTMKIGTTIRGYRLQKGLSQGDVEKRTGLLRCYLSRVENGHTVPSLDTLAKIAQALDLPLAQFFVEDSLGREINTRKLSDDDLRFLTQMRRYSTNLNDSDRKLLLAMVKKFATTAVR
jgi:transcriptional regulator with XRE-family HTH domain